MGTWAVSIGAGPARGGASGLWWWDGPTGGGAGQGEEEGHFSGPHP